MRKIELKYLFIVVIIATGCSSNNQTGSILPFIDVRKNYPEKEIILTDIAEVVYVHLSTENEDYLYQGGIRDITENTIVIHDNSSDKILFFSKDGTPKSFFNRKGQGTEEYTGVRFIIFDEDADDVFIYSMGNIFQVYSSTGEYKRTLFLPEGIFVNGCASFDRETFIVYDESSRINRTQKGLMDFSIEHKDSSFIQISNVDGKVIHYLELSDKNIVLRDDRNFGDIRGPVGRTSRLIKCKEGVLICNPETDTVFLYGTDKSLKPVIHKTPLVSDLDPMVYMNNCVDVGRYQFIEVFTVRWDEGAFPFPVKYYIRDTKTGEIFRQKIILPDYHGKEFIFSPLQTGRDYENGTFIELDLIELKQAYKDNRLGGKLKELVATLNELEDNNVFMFICFR